MAPSTPTRRRRDRASSAVRQSVPPPDWLVRSLVRCAAPDADCGLTGSPSVPPLVSSNPASAPLRTSTLSAGDAARVQGSRRCVPVSLFVASHAAWHGCADVLRSQPRAARPLSLSSSCLLSRAALTSPSPVPGTASRGPCVSTPCAVGGHRVALVVDPVHALPWQPPSRR
ncbi:hypothetical protein PsYK624_170880 [Phanerochaete sordida]|uniref:Uncharacterized protein n=1 Tax=Phanerochaete sordida TaxID=48140 RepID=A0A9P3GTG1_9APHY|nr:hypothetical protein PsYK624_170880 [Phanerochaete sordida]